MTKESNGMFYCPLCGKRTAIWQSDWDDNEELFGVFDGPSISPLFTCTQCGAFIETTAPISLEKDNATQTKV